MHKHKWILLTLIIWLWAFPVQSETVRFALVAGNDRGANRKDTLRYAEFDAEKLAQLLVELGGFQPDYVSLIKGGSEKDFADAFEKISNRIQEQVPSLYPRAL